MRAVPHHRPRVVAPVDAARASRASRPTPPRARASLARIQTSPELSRVQGPSVAVVVVASSVVRRPRASSTTVARPARAPSRVAVAVAVVAVAPRASLRVDADGPNARKIAAATRESVAPSVRKCHQTSY